MGFIIAISVQCSLVLATCEAICWKILLSTILALRAMDVCSKLWFSY